MNNQNIKVAHKLFIDFLNDNYKESKQQRITKIFNLAEIPTELSSEGLYNWVDDLNVDYTKKSDNLTRATIASRIAAEMELNIV